MGARSAVGGRRSASRPLQAAPPVPPCTIHHTVLDPTHANSPPARAVERRAVLRAFPTLVLARSSSVRAGSWTGGVGRAGRMRAGRSTSLRRRRRSGSRRGEDSERADLRAQQLDTVDPCLSLPFSRLDAVWRAGTSLCALYSLTATCTSLSLERGVLLVLLHASSPLSPPTHADSHRQPVQPPRALAHTRRETQLTRPSRPLLQPVRSPLVTPPVTHRSREHPREDCEDELVPSA